MDRHEAIKNAYKDLGGEATFYDGMITCSTLPGKAVCKLVWNMDKRKNTRYLDLALSGIPKDFSGRMLEVPGPVRRAAARAAAGRARQPPDGRADHAGVRGAAGCRHHLPGLLPGHDGTGKAAGREERA